MHFKITNRNAKIGSEKNQEGIENEKERKTK